MNITLNLTPTSFPLFIIPVLVIKHISSVKHSVRPSMLGILLDKKKNLVVFFLIIYPMIGVKQGGTTHVCLM